MIVSQATVNAINELVTQCFTENRMLDAIVDTMIVKLKYPLAAELIHKDMAHAFPLIADELGEKCLQRYDISVKYGSTPAGVADYSSIFEVCQAIEGRMVDFQSMLIGACKIAQENGDYHVFVDLMDILEDFNPFVEQAMGILDQAKRYGDSPSFDKNFEKYWILGKD